MTVAKRVTAVSQPEAAEPVALGESINRVSGDDYIVEWPDYMVRMHFSMVHEDSDSLKAELLLYVDLPGAPSPAEWTNITLSSQTTRAQIANRLKEQWSGPVPPPYRDMLKAAAVWVAERFRRGEPMKKLGPQYQPAPMRHTLFPLYPAGQITSIYGDGAAGKSYLLLLTLLAMQEGLAICGLRPIGKSKVLYLDYECNWDEQQVRLLRIASGLGLKTFNEILYRECYRPIHFDIGQIHRIVDDERVDVVAIDSMGLASGGDPKEARDAIRTLSALRQLRRTVIVLDHVTKDGEQGKAIGSNYKFQYSRSAWEAIKAQENDADAIHTGLFHRKANNNKLLSPLGFHLQFDGDEGPVTVAREDVRDVEGLSKRVSSAERIAHALSRGPVYLAQLYELLPDVDQGAVRQALSRGQKGGRFVQLDSGAWGVGHRS